MVRWISERRPSRTWVAAVLRAVFRAKRVCLASSPTSRAGSGKLIWAWIFIGSPGAGEGGGRGSAAGIAAVLGFFGTGWAGLRGHRDGRGCCPGRQRRTEQIGIHRLHRRLDLLPLAVAVVVQANAHGRVQGVVAAVQHLVARAALDPAVRIPPIELGQDALLGRELLEPFARQVLAEVHVARARGGDGELAQQQVFGGVHAHVPQLHALGPFLAIPVDVLDAGRAEYGHALFASAFDRTQAGELVLVLAHPVVDSLGLVAGVDGDARQAQAPCVVGLGVAALQVGGDLLPVLFAGRVALDDVVVHRPGLQAPGPGPDGDLPAVALHVHACGEHQSAHGHLAQGEGFGPGLQGVFVAALAFDLPGFTEGFVDEELHGARIALLQGRDGFFKLFDDAGPAALGAVGGPDLHAQGFGRSGGLALAVAPDAVGAVAFGGLAADPGAGHGLATGQVVGLGDGLAAVGADVAHGVGLAALPLEAVGPVLAAPHQGVLRIAVGARNVEAHIAFGVVAGAFNVAKPLHPRGGAADELRVGRAFEPPLGQAARVAGLLDQLVEGAPLVQDGHRYRDAAVGPLGFAAQEVQHAVAEGFELDGVFVGLALLASLAHGLHRIEHGVDLAFDVRVAVIVGGLPQGLLAPAVGDVVGHKRRDHLGVAHALGFHHRQVFDAVIAHEVQDAGLEGPADPAAFLVELSPASLKCSEAHSLRRWGTSARRLSRPRRTERTMAWAVSLCRVTVAVFKTGALLCRYLWGNRCRRRPEPWRPLAR